MIRLLLLVIIACLLFVVLWTFARWALVLLGACIACVFLYAVGGWLAIVLPIAGTAAVVIWQEFTNPRT